MGIRPRIKSRAQRQVFCIPCGVSIALGPPPEGAFNLSVYHVLRDMVGKEMGLLQYAWEQLEHPNARLKRMPGSRPDKAFAMALPEPVTHGAVAASG